MRAKERARVAAMGVPVDSRAGAGAGGGGGGGWDGAKGRPQGEGWKACKERAEVKEAEAKDSG